MIACDKCSWENPPKQMFCISCGNRLALDSENIDHTFIEEVRSEREAATTREVEQFFMASIFLFIIAIVFRVSIASNPPQPKVLPGLESPMSVVADKEIKSIQYLPDFPVPND